ncbi:MAG: hypothetical protein IJ212_08060, partial [Bacteroidaceae bacterium]|nr:hypothetical protein [Bacteroidaceae bacterium]
MKKYRNLVITLAVTLGLFFPNNLVVSAEEEPLNTRIELSVNQDLSAFTDGTKVRISAEVFTDAGEKVDDGNVTIYYKQETSGNYSTTSGTINVRANTNYNIYAEYSGSDLYSPSTSDTRTIAVKKFAALRGYLSATSTPADESVGNITLDETYPDFDIVNALSYHATNSSDTVVSGTSISNLSEGKYYVTVPARQDGDTFYISSGYQSIDVAEGEAPVKYSGKVTADERISWTISYFEAEENSNRVYTTYVSSVDEAKYYVSDVVATPSENASVSYYPNTGEVSISNIKGDFVLSATIVEKAAPAKLSVEKVSVSEGQNYSEDNAFKQFLIDVKVVDENGNPIPNVKIYYKADEKEVSFTEVSATDENGIATFKYSYGIDKSAQKVSYNPLFALSTDFKEEDLLISKNINLVLQKKADLELYEDQLVGTEPETYNGKVTGVPDTYEIWTGEVHQGAIVIGSGQWVGPVNGEFTGLSTGQHIIRFGERFDAATTTFYFASDYNYFEIPRGVKKVEDSEEKQESSGDGVGNDNSGGSTSSDSSSSDSSSNDSSSNDSSSNRT